MSAGVVHDGSVAGQSGCSRASLWDAPGLLGRAGQSAATRLPELEPVLGPLLEPLLSPWLVRLELPGRSRAPASLCPRLMRVLRDRCCEAGLQKMAGAKPPWLGAEPSPGSPVNLCQSHSEVERNLGMSLLLCGVCLHVKRQASKRFVPRVALFPPRGAPDLCYLGLTTLFQWGLASPCPAPPSSGCMEWPVLIVCCSS
jgi:hypothetical protein